jgi:hypothetical protein
MTSNGTGMPCPSTLRVLARNNNTGTGVLPRWMPIEILSEAFRLSEEQQQQDDEQLDTGSNITARL